VKPYYANAWEDFVGGLRHWRIWTHLGWQEVKRRYRRTVLGPFWATLSIGMFIGGMSFIWAPLFRTDVKAYLPYLTAGMVSWSFTVALITEGCATYTSGNTLLTTLRFPFTILNFMVIWRNIIVFFHNILIVVLVVAILPVPVSWRTLLVIHGRDTKPVIYVNYIYHLIEVMRAPMLGQVPSMLTYAVTISGAVVGWFFAFEIYARFRRRIPYWL
jgi:lipopolysaccharide transport system permease protein